MTAARAARVALALAALAVVAAAVLILATHDGASQLGAGQAAAATTTTTSAPLPPTRLTKLPHRTIINGMSPLVVRLSAAPAPTSPRPYLSPNVNGTWTTINNEEVFTPASTLEPCSSYSLTIPAATTAVAHAPYGHQRTIALQVGCPSVRGLQVALARLNYLPDHLHPHFGRPQHRGPLTRVQAAALAWDPPSGHLVAQYPDAPPVAYGNGSDGPTIGALEIFQADHGIDATGVPDTRTWESLLAAETHDRRNPSPYTWVTVTETIPETLEVHRDGHVVLSTPANTGVPGAATAQGDVPDLLALRLDDDDRHQPGRQPLQRPRRAVGQLLQRRRRGARLPARLLRHAAVQRLRRAADLDGADRLRATCAIGDIVWVQ